MTDLEITKLCAEAMGYSPMKRKGDHVHLNGVTIPGVYWPLENDAQAMALVKKHRMTIEDNGMPGPERWDVYGAGGTITSDNLNRAICEYVAKMQAAK